MVVECCNNNNNQNGIDTSNQATARKDNQIKETIEYKISVKSAIHSENMVRSANTEDNSAITQKTNCRSGLDVSNSKSVNSSNVVSCGVQIGLDHNSTSSISKRSTNIKIRNSTEKQEHAETGLNISVINIRSIRNNNKIRELAILLKREKIDILIVTEVWTEKDEEKYFKIEGYNSEFESRTGRGGGVALYIKEHIQYKRLKSQEIEKCDVVELILKKTKTKIIGIYRPPSKQDENFFIEDIDRITEKYNKSVIIMGDMNIDLLEETAATKKYLEGIQQNGYEVVNKVSKENITRINVNNKNGGSIIDHVITNISDKLKFFEVLYLGLSDHNMLNTGWYFENEKKKKIKKVIKKTNYNRFRQALKFKIEQEQEGHIKSFSDLINMIKMEFDKNTKSKTIKIREGNDWITEDIIKKTKQRDSLYKKLHKQKNNDNMQQEYKRVKKEVQSLIETTKKERIENNFERALGNPRKTWKEINTLLHRNEKKANVWEECTMDGTTPNNRQQTANKLNEYFAEIGEKLANIIMKEPNWVEKITLNSSLQNSFYLKECDEEEVSNIINDLQNNKAPGPDTITVSMLKNISEVIVPVITYLANKIFEKGEFPEELKQTTITPIHKQGDKDKPENYRPIALTSVFSKIVEKLIKKRIINYLQKIKILSNRQYAFQENIGTKEAVTELITEVEDELEKKQYITILFLDLKKAFDTISKTILAKKLEKLGLRGKQLELITSYLNNRPQITKLDQTRSNTNYASYGVPQGSVLGPLLYLIYINDIEDIEMEGKIYLFADDTCIMYSGKTMDEIQQKVNKDMPVLEQWFKSNLLTLNTDKTKYMTIANRNKTIKELNIKINNNKIEPTTNYKYLGIWIDSQLSWNTHVEKITKKLNPLIGAIRRISRYLPGHTLKSIYYSFIVSNISYLIGIWGNTSTSNLQRIQRLQNKALKAINSLHFRTPTQQLHENEMLVETRLKYQLALTIHEITNGYKRSNIKLIKNKQIHNHQTRRNNALHITNQRTDIGKKRITYIGTKIYNKIPTKIKEIKSINKFKHKLQRFLLENQFK